MRLLLRAAQKLAPPTMEITMLGLNGIPFYDSDIEVKGDPSVAAALKRVVRDADGVLLSTPRVQWRHLRTVEECD